MIQIIKKFGTLKRVLHFILNISMYLYMIYAKKEVQVVKSKILINYFRFTLNEINRLMFDILSVLKYFESIKSVASWGISINSIFYDKE